MRHDCGGIYDERGVVKGEVLVVDWSIVAAFVKLLRAALPNPIQFSIVRAKLRFLSCGVNVWLVRFLASGSGNKELMEGPCTTVAKSTWNNIQTPSLLWEFTATINQIRTLK